jgi:hypothetical protein
VSRSNRTADLRVASCNHKTQETRTAAASRRHNVSGAVQNGVCGMRIDLAGS